MLNAPAPQSNLTHRQLLIWLEQQLDADSTANHAVAMFRIAGEVDAERFGRAFRSVVARSDALRTTFAGAGRPMQQVHPEPHGGVEFADLSGAVDPDSALARWLADRQRQPLPLGERPFDSTLVRLRPAEWIWHLRMHNLIADAWSLSIVYRRTLEAYGGAPELPFPQYEAYLEYERRYRTSTKARADEAFWKQKLAERLEPLAFCGRVADKRSPFLARRTFTLTTARADALRRRAAEGAHRSFTPPLAMFSALMSVLFAHLHRMTGLRRIGIGAPFANRSSKAFRETIGRFAEISSFRADIEAGETFASLHRETSAEIADVLEHAQHCHGNPLHRRAFEVLLNFHNATFPPLDGRPTIAELSTGLLVDGDENGVSTRTAGSGELLVVNVHDFAATGTPSLSFDFNREIFDHAARETAEIDFLRLLDAFAEDPSRPIDDVTLSAPPTRLDASARIGRSASVGTFEPPQSDTELKIAVLWQEALGLERVGRRESFFDAGGDSLLAVRLLQAVESAFGVKVPLGALFAEPTVEALAAAVAAGNSAAGPAIIPLQGRGSDPPLFFICGIQIYHELAAEIGPVRPSYGIFLPIEEQILERAAPSREPAITVEEMARQYLALVREKQPRGPYSLAGLSFGGVLAFEVAQQLRDQGEDVALLALFDSILPRAHKRVLLPWLASHAKALARLDLSRAREGFAARAARMHLARADALARLRESIYTHAAQAYDGRIRPFNGPVMLFRASDRAQAPGWRVDRRNGWADVVSHGLEVVDVPGDHVGILRRPWVRVLAERLRPRLGAHAGRAP